MVSSDKIDRRRSLVDSSRAFGPLELALWIPYRLSRISTTPFTSVVGAYLPGVKWVICIRGYGSRRAR